MTDTPRPHRRWLRFSLRSLLIVVTLLCVVLGTWVHRSLRQRNALATLLEIDPAFAFWHSPTDPDALTRGPRSAEWLADWIGIDFLEGVVRVDIEELDDARLQALLDLRGLTVLEIAGGESAFADADFARLSQLTGLKRVAIYPDIESDEGFARLKSLKQLEQLDVKMNPGMTDQGLGHLGRITSLRRFDCGALTRCTNQGVAQLRGLRNLESLSLVFEAGLTDDVLEPLQSLTNLKDLHLNYYGQTTRSGLKFLQTFTRLEDLELSERAPGGALAEIAALPQLTRMTFRFDQLTTDALTHLTKFPGLEQLSLTGTCQIDEPFVATLSKLHKLGFLKINTNQGGVTDEAVKALTQLKSVYHLELRGCEELTDQGLLQLAELRQLKYLWLSGHGRDQPSQSARARLSAALPNCKIQYGDKRTTSIYFHP